MGRWLSRCSPGLFLISFVLLLAFAFTDVEKLLRLFLSVRAEGEALRYDDQYDAHHSRTIRLKWSQSIFIWYSIILHMDTLVFSLRLCLAIIHVVRGIKKTLGRREDQDLSLLVAPAPAGSELSRCTTPVSEISVIESECDSSHSESTLITLEDPDEVTHSIILPNYGEDLETLSTTLRVLASHERAQTQYEVYLAMEEREQTSHFKAATLLSEFETKFLAIRSTFHPAGVPGEVAGKGSNVAFAARKIFDHHAMDKNKANVAITVIDSDTHLAPDYFSEIRRIHHSHAEAADAIYVCPIVFDRNSHDIPVFVRVADIMWGCAGLAAFLPGSPLMIPTSVYTMSLTLAERIGGWDGDATAIGEDMHACIKAYFQSSGKLVTLPVYSAASQCNISSSRPSGWFRTFDTLRARWRQAIRHMWGALDVGYSFRSMAQMRMVFRTRTLALVHLLWEAHVLPTHFVLIIAVSGVYQLLTPAELIHPDLAFCFWFTNHIRNLGFLSMQLVFTLYSAYHSLCVEQRARDMLRAGIPEVYARRHSWTFKYLIDRVAFPVAGVAYGALPAFYAQLAHMWTENLVYGVSVKPMLKSLV